MKKKFALATGVALLAMVFASPALADRIVVDNDGAQCPNPDSFTIQGGVFLASPGDTVFVCAGTYGEEVLISGPLKNGIRVVGADVDEVIVDGNNTMGNGFRLEDVTGVELSSFTVRRYHDDIWLENADGNRIRDNRTSEAWDHDGIVMANDSDGNVVEHNVSFNNTRPIGCGISAGGGSGDNVIRNNLTFGNTNAGILLGGGILGPAGPGNRILHNESRNNPGQGILIANSGSAQVAHNDVHDNGQQGIQLTGAVTTGVDVEHNEVVDNGSTPNNDGIRLTAGASNNVVRHNHAEGHDNSGIGLLNAGTGNVVAHNDVSDNGRNGILNTNTIGTLIEHNKANRNVGFGGPNGSGIRIMNSNATAAPIIVRRNSTDQNSENGISVGMSQNVTVERNHSDRNALDGIRSGPAPTGGNFYVGNHMRHNGGFDANDLNRPANTWTDNHCETDNPPGTIC